MQRFRVWSYRTALRSCTALYSPDMVGLVSVPHIGSVNSTAGWLDVWNELIAGSALSPCCVFVFWHALHHSALSKRDKLATERMVLVHHWNLLPSNLQLLKWFCISLFFNPWRAVRLIYLSVSPPLASIP